MRRPTFNPEITLGNLVQVATIIVAIVYAWADVKKDVTRHEVQIQQMTASVEKMSGTQADLAQNLSVLTAIVNERWHTKTIQ